jgi:hypothetical protein
MFLRLRLVPLSGLGEGQPGAGTLERPDCCLSGSASGPSQRAAADDAGPRVAVQVIATDEHIAARPSWDCRSCGLPWPCDSARERLASEMDRTSLAIFMWSNLEEAVRDMPVGPPAELFERFIRWTH